MNFEFVANVQCKEGEAGACGGFQARGGSATGPGRGRGSGAPGRGQESQLDPGKIGVGHDEDSVRVQKESSLELKKDWVDLFRIGPSMAKGHELELEQ